MKLYVNGLIIGYGSLYVFACFCIRLLRVGQ